MSSATFSIQDNKLLKNKAFRYLLSAQLVSNLGDWLDYLALLTLIGLRWEATPFELSAAVLSFALPMLLCGPIAGVLADRFDRRKLMIISDLARIVIVIAIVFTQELWQVYVLLVWKGGFEALFAPAKSGKLKEIIPFEQLDQALSYSSILEQGAKIVGPAMGGVFITFVGIYACFYINAVTFLVSALLLCGVPRTSLNKTEQIRDRHKIKGKSRSTHAFLTEMLEGYRYIINQPFIFYGTLLFSLTLMVLQIADSQIIVLLRELSIVNSSGLGLCMGAAGAGMITVASVIGKWGGTLAFRQIAIGAVVMGTSFGSAAILVGYQVHWLWLPLLFLIGGGAAGLIIVPFQAGLHKRTPMEMTGRVFGLVGVIASAATLLGPLIGGILSTIYGPITAFVISGSLLVCIGTGAWLVRKKVERKDHSEIC